MKTLLFINSCLLISLCNVNAQSSLLVTHITNSISNMSDNEVINKSISANATDAVYINLKNTSSTTKIYKMRRYDDVLNSGAYAYFTFGAFDYTPTTYTSTSSLTLTPNQDASSLNETSELQFTEAPTTGLSEIRYQIYEVNNANDVFTFTLKYNSTTSIKSNENLITTLSHIYPNPSTHLRDLQITSNENFSNVLVTVTNSLGEIISSKPVDLFIGINNLQIDPNDLNEGIYFVTITTLKGKVTQKIVTAN